jgi:hypothetical protein
MNRLGIETGLDLRAQTMPFLQQHFGKSGSYFYWIARGIDDRPVRADRIRKSIGAENTFSVDLFTFETAQDALLPIIDKVWRHCETSGTRGRIVTLKIKYTDFQQITRSVSLPGVIEERTALERIALDLLKGQFPVAKGIRLSFHSKLGTPPAIHLHGFRHGQCDAAKIIRPHGANLSPRTAWVPALRRRGAVTHAGRVRPAPLARSGDRRGRRRPAMPTSRAS